MNTILSLRVDSQLKTSAQSLANDMGLPLSVVVNNYLRDFVEKREIIFTETVVSQKSIDRIDDIIEKNMKDGVSKGYHTIAELRLALNAD